MIAKRFLKLFLVVAVFGLVLLSIAITLFASERGSRWLVYWLIDRNDIPLEIESIDGRLLDDMRLHGLYYRDEDGNEVRARRIGLHWSAVELLRFRFHAQRIDAEQLHIKTSGETSTAATTQIELPLSVNVEQVALNGIRIETSAFEQDIDRLYAAVHADADRIELRLDKAQRGKQKVSGEFRWLPKPSAEWQVDLQWTGELDEQPGHGRLRLHGPLQALILQLEVESIVRLSASGSMDLGAAVPAFNLAGELSGPLPVVMADYLAWNAPAQFQLSGNAHFIEARVNTELQTLAGESLKFKAQADAALPTTSSNVVNVTVNWQTETGQQGSLLNMSGQADLVYENRALKLQHELNAPWIVQLDAEVDLQDDQPRYEVRADWQDVRLSITDDRDIRIPGGHLVAGGTLDAINLRTRTRFLPVAAGTSGADENEAEQDYVLAVDGEMDLTTADPAADFSGTLQAPLPMLLREHLQKLDPVAFNLRLAARMLDVDLDGRAVASGGEPFRLKLHGRSDLPAGHREVEYADFDWSVSPESAEEHALHVSGQGKLQYREQQLVIDHHLLSPFASSLTGKVDLGVDDPVLQLSLDWSGLDFVLADANNWHSDRGEIRLDGPLSALAIEVQADFQDSPAGPFNLAARSHWSDPVLQLQALNLNILKGRLKAKGQLNLDDKKHGSLVIVGRDLNLDTLNPDLVSRLDLDANLEGVLRNGTLEGQLDLTSLSGEWRGYPLQGRANIARQGERMRIDLLQLQSGDNTVRLKLDMNRTLDGVADLSLTDLEVFSSELQGTLEGRIEIVGTRETPRFTARLAGKDLYAFELRVASLTVDSTVDTRPHQHSVLNLQTGTLQYRDWILDGLSLTGQGQTEGHTLDMEATGRDVTFSAKFSGGLRDKHWRGALNRLDLATTHTDAWTMETPAMLDWATGSGELSLGSTCLARNAARLCLQASGDGINDIRANLQLDRVPLALVQPWLPDTLTLKGVVSGVTTVKRTAGDWALDTDLQGYGTRISVGLSQDVETLEVPRASFQARLDRQRREWDLQLAAADVFDLHSTGVIANSGNKPVSARLDLDLQRIDWLARIEPALTGSTGSFTARAEATGTLQQPQVHGEYYLRNGHLLILPLGLKLEGIDGELHNANETRQLNLDSVLTGNGKQLRLQGHATLDPKAGFPYQAQITGNSFPAIRTADVTLDASPNLNLHGTRELHHVRGEIHIPRLQMQVTSLPEGSVSVSPDTVIIQSRQAGAAHVAVANGDSDFIRQSMDIDIKLILGQDIHVQGFGLDTRLAGDLKVIKPVGVYQPRGEGFVTLHDGSYRAYGQNLVIEQGQLQFAGPLDNPGVLLRAYRPNLSVRPGVRLDGSVRRPRLSLYSEPAQSDADTLAYLITGRPISGASGSEANLLTQAALSLGTQQSSVLTSEIESLFSLDEFNVGAGSTVQSTSVSAAKRLGPNLTLRSSFNPFDQLWSFLLNYQLTDHWSVQTESGASQGADIIYSIETSTLADLFRKLWSFGDRDQATPK